MTNCKESAANIEYKASPPVRIEDLDALLAASWPNHASGRDHQAVLDRSLVFVCAYHRSRLVGFVNVAWDGGIHAFILDTTVHPDYRRQGIGTELVRRAATAAGDRGVEWLHVDYEPRLHEFYRKCGFRATMAGLMHLQRMESA